ncbi:M24 family metallopeptidase [Amphibacillus jilinensis]|uniref:M24 family metallopeptidase n=1 Tax=Amphibacillus jilinensis TaxID=1216008 RepID=UPI0002F5A228|nr:aminopeptidase P family protein [Amphibacillus jilinensis]
MKTNLITFETCPEPRTYADVAPVTLTDQTIEARKNKVLQSMQEENIDVLIIYADKEHGSNFEYLTGFIPRFEEGLLVIDKSGKSTVVLGNENLKLANLSRIKVNLIHSPLFSLPNQPMENDDKLENIFSRLNLQNKQRIGLIGWKMFTTSVQPTEQMLDIPYFIVDALKNVTKDDVELVNGAYLFIGDRGARTTNNANEIAHYEYGANLASTHMLKALNAIEIGAKETEIGAHLNAEGQYNSVVTIAATGKRFEKANIYPSYKQVKRGDPMSLTVGYKGGLSSRAGLVVENDQQLPEDQTDYLEAVAKPYYQAVVTWLETIKTGIKGDQLYQAIERVFPKEKYHWHLNPGHLVADEEWMASPIYNQSSEILKSGMIFQIDIIPSVPGYTGVSAEECVALADQTLQADIKKQYPELWERISSRKTYLQDVLNIEVSPDVLPLSNTVAYLRPFYLAKDKALKVK